jgi:ATP-dependent protease ClpP protease subunit
MNRFIISLICLCSFVPGCAMVTNIKQETIPISKWVDSPEAKRGYIYLSGSITKEKALNFVEKLNELNKNNDIKRIRLVINITGEVGMHTETLIKAINISKKVIDVINIGACYSNGVAVFAAATGKRYAFSDTTFAISSQMDKENYLLLENMLEFETEKYKTLIKSTSNLPEEWLTGEDSMFIFSEKEAKTYNLIDEIITDLP